MRLSALCLVFLGCAVDRVAGQGPFFVDDSTVFDAALPDLGARPDLLVAPDLSPEVDPQPLYLEDRGCLVFHTPSGNMWVLFNPQESFFVFTVRVYPGCDNVWGTLGFIVHSSIQGGWTSEGPNLELWIDNFQWYYPIVDDLAVQTYVGDDPVGMFVGFGVAPWKFRYVRSGTLLFQNVGEYTMRLKMRNTQGMTINDALVGQVGMPDPYYIGTQKAPLLTGGVVTFGQ